MSVDQQFGPWSVATEVPDEIQKIPASSPVNNIKYIYIWSTGSGGALAALLSSQQTREAGRVVNGLVSVSSRGHSRAPIEANINNDGDTRPAERLSLFLPQATRPS